MTPRIPFDPKSVAGLSQRIAERDHVVVVGRIEHRDKDGFYGRKAGLEDLKRAAGGAK